MAPTDALADANERPSETFPLRGGGSLALTSERLYVDRSEEETVFVDFEDVVEVVHDEFDYFVGVMSAGLVAFGLFSTTRNVFGGLALAAAGAGSLYLTYRKRGELTVTVSNRPRPLTVYPENPEDVYEALGPHMAEQ
ncbi:hypothetical protein [Halobacterium zhouii]|uniref:hypothetical protein n=1 Tax=Halobacterium zhouii TaxID=2902624 RepID=UPI001E503817|nr:hypothetical protein [Halobacterium zhouii]